MTVKELIAVLTKLPEEHMVVIDGYEGGLDEIIASSIINIELDHFTKWYYGPHKIDKAGKNKSA